MLSRKTIERLAALQDAAGILSVYLKLDPALRYERGQASQKFRGGLARFLRNATEEQQAIARREEPRILALLNQPTPPGRALVIFSSETAGIWEALSLDVLLPTWVSADRTTYTGPLAQVIDEYPRLVVAVVQRDQGAIYVSEQRAAATEAEVTSDVPGQHVQGGWAQARFQRHIEAHVQKHLGKLVDGLKDLYYDRPFNRLAVGGTEDVTAEFVKMLPEPLPGLVIGVFGVDFKHDNEDAVLDKARALATAYEREQERALVERMVDATEAQGRGVLGIDDTIAALREGRVHTLVCADGVEKEGSACLSCDYISAETFERCPACGGDAQAVPDVIDRAIERAFQTDARVEIAFGEAREWLLARGGIGALLRY
jgi:peptide chain release factor subunit 1